jgi:Dyp-type peroxidase family
VRRAAAHLQVSQIQRSVVRGSSLPAAEFRFFEVIDPAAARDFLGRIADQVTTATHKHSPDFMLTVAMSYRGLERLGVPVTSLGGFPDAFRAGMAARAAQLGDDGTNAEQYRENGADGASDVLLWTAGTAPDLSRRTAALIKDAKSHGLTERIVQEAGHLPGDARREHFGFADGLSQPRVAGLHADRPAKRGTALAERPVAAGEFVLGYLDEDRAIPPAPEPQALTRNGSYLVYRKLQQDVAAFRRLLLQHASLFAYGSEEVAAKLVGRWRDGSPLILAPRAPDPELGRRRRTANAFGYGRDPDGWVCPAGAHIRRANPRDALPFKGALVERHRMIRRGIPYGPALPANATEDDGVDRGLVFICFVADIARQFEFVQARWLQDGNAFGLGEDRDPLIGTGQGRYVLNGRPPRYICGMPDLVTPRWGEYLFAPGVQGVRWISLLGGEA